MIRYNLSRNTLTLWRVLFTVMLLGIAVALCALFAVSFLLTIILLIILMLIYLSLILFYLPLYCKSSYVLLSSKGLYCAKGVFIRREYVVPNPRVVIIEKVKIPLYSYFGLCSVLIRGLGLHILLPAMEVEKSH
ncbi:MAG: hypothetical protein RR177_03035 [Oscillospiraceae bacterium]